MSGQLQAFVVQAVARAKGVSVDVVSGGLNAGAVEWVILIEMVMGFITQMIEQCQQTEEELAASATAPSRMQKVWFRAYVAANWRDRGQWGWRFVARDTADATLAEAARMTLTTLVGIVDEVRKTATGKH